MIAGTPDPLAGLLDMVRREAAAAAKEAVRDELLRARQARDAGPRMLSLAALGRLYGAGRLELQRLIATGRLPFTERRCRGGRTGVFVAREDAELVLAGRAKP